MTSDAIALDGLAPESTAATGRRSLKVMHVITDLDVGGAERMLVSYLTASRPAAPEAFVVSLLSGGYFARWLRREGLRVFEMDMGRAVSNVLSVFRLALMIRREKPDVVQSWMYHADLVLTIALLLSGRLQHTRLYWGVRCSDMDTSKYRLTLRFAIWACSWLSRIPDAIIANSHAGMRVHKDLGYHGDHFVVIPNGVDTGRFVPDPAIRRAVRQQLSIPEEAIAVAMVARRDPMKDHDTFIEALDQLPGVIGVLAGKGTEELPDKPNLRRLGIREDIERVYAACDCVALCSAFGEGFPNVLVEGMSAGLVPVATDVGDCAIIVGDAGEVVPPRDPGAFADALARLFRNGPTALADQGKRARERIEELFALNRAVSGFDRIYTEAPFEEAQLVRLQPTLAITSALVSRLAAFGTLIAAARLLDPVDFGVFAVLTAVVGVINAVVSGGGDMWLNSFTGSFSRRTRQAPRVSPHYLAICAVLAATTVGLSGSVLALSYLPPVQQWVATHVPDVAPLLTQYPLVILLAILGACLSGLFEALLAVLRSGSRVTAFFVFRDLTTPLILLGLILILRPTDAIGMMMVYAGVWGGIFLVAFLYVRGAPDILPRMVAIGRQRWKSLLRHTAGLLYGNFGSRLSIHIDVLVLAHIVSIASVGEYRAAAQFAIGFMVVQHFVFLSLPWQLRRTTQSGQPGQGYHWVNLQQKTLLGVAFLALILLWVFAEALLGLLGDRFELVASIFRFFVVIRFIELLWGPNHEMLVSQGHTIRDAHANMVILFGWIAAFMLARAMAMEAIPAAVIATIGASCLGQAVRYRMLRQIGLLPVMGHRLGPALPLTLSAVLAVGAGTVL